MAEPKFYVPGGEGQYYKDKIAGQNGDAEKDLAIKRHDWAPNPPEHTSQGGVRHGRVRIKQESFAELLNFVTTRKVTGKDLLEIFRWRSIPVVLCLYLLFHFTSFGKICCTFHQQTIGWTMAAYGVLYAAIALLFPTATKKLTLDFFKLVIFIIFIIIMAAILILVVSAFGQHK